MGAIVGLVRTVLIWLITKALLAFGVGFLAYKGSDTLLRSLKHHITASFGGVPSDVYNILMIAGFGKAISVIFSCYVFSFGYNTTRKLTAGLKK